MEKGQIFKPNYHTKTTAGYYDPGIVPGEKTHGVSNAKNGKFTQPNQSHAIDRFHTPKQHYIYIFIVNLSQICGRVFGVQLASRSNTFLSDL